MEKPEISEVLNLYKRKSETPLQTIERYVARHHRFAKAKMTYAGRLDPMAEGVLVVLAGEKNKERDAYTGLDKEYEFEFVLGAETDTFDVLGLPVAGEEGAEFGASVDEKRLEAALKKYQGTILQTYPPYSSKVVDGMPLFEYARLGKLETIELPKHEVEAKEIALLGKREVSVAELEKEIVGAIEAVKGDFRQEQTVEAWKRRFAEAKKGAISIYKARVACGSGFYVRQLVADVGKDLGTGAVTLSILRTRVGGFLLSDSV